MTKFKGEHGYLHSRKIKLGIASLVGFILMLGILLTGIIIWGSTKNYLTILAVIVVLPTAKVYVQYMMIPRKSTASAEEFTRIQALCGELKLYGELLITAQEKGFAVMFTVVDKDDNIVCYTNQDNVEADKFEKGVTNFLNYYDYDSHVKLFCDLKQFEKRIKQLAAKNTELTKEQKEHIATVFEKISIMSI